MWVIKGFLFLVLLFALVYFFVTNSNQTVDINLFGKLFLDISIYWVVAISFLLGFVGSFLLAAIREIRFHREIGRLRRDNRAKEQEIADLRTLPLQELSEEEAPPSLTRGAQAGE